MKNETVDAASILNDALKSGDKDHIKNVQLLFNRISILESAFKDGLKIIDKSDEELSSPIFLIRSLINCMNKKNEKMQYEVDFDVVGFSDYISNLLFGYVSRLNSKVDILEDKEIMQALSDLDDKFIETKEQYKRSIENEII